MDKHFSALYPADTRFYEIKEALGFIRAGNASQVIGIPGIGRTHFLSLLAFNKKVRELHLGEKAGQYHFVLFDFTPLKDEPLQIVVKSILQTVMESLEEREMGKEAAFVKNIFHETRDSLEVTELFQGLKRAVDFLAHERDMAIVFLFDAFEVYAPHLDPRFFSHLTALRDHLRYKASFVFSLNRPLESMVDSELISPVNQLISGHTIWLSLADRIGNNFLLQFLEEQFETTIKDEIYASLLQATGGLGRLVKVTLEEVMRNKIAADVFEEFARENRAMRSILYEIWESLHANEQLVLKKVVSGGKGAVEDISFNYLQEAHLLRDTGSLTIPLFQNFVQYRIEHLETSAFSYRADTNDILKGDIVISENFTTSEFRLLTHLLQHKEQLVTRDELIKAAWSDAKSTAGVTDQAVDQLLYRLRRKIEADPNTPLHLQTVKGRGVKFIP